ncbi:MAG: hypothetical protein KF708_10370 [Pirellulales bacterium]|nr:hypothetical protein [Pirellulales bacterium]
MTTNPYESPQAPEVKPARPSLARVWFAVATFTMFSSVNFTVGTWLTYSVDWPVSWRSGQIVPLTFGLTSLACFPLSVWLAIRFLRLARELAATPSEDLPPPTD